MSNEEPNNQQRNSEQDKNEQQKNEQRKNEQQPTEVRNEQKKEASEQPEPAPVAESCAIEITEMKAETSAAEPAGDEPAAKAEEPGPVRAAYEHPLPIRITHW